MRGKNQTNLNKENVHHAILLSFNKSELIKVKIIDKHEGRELIGIVKSVSEAQSKFKIEIEEGYEFIDFEEVLTVELLECAMD